jgi:predicted DNA-binding protein
MPEKSDSASKVKRRGNRQVCVRLPAPILSRLEAIGAPLGLEVTQVVRRAIEEYIVNRPANPPARR